MAAKYGMIEIGPGISVFANIYIGNVVVPPWTQPGLLLVTEVFEDAIQTESDEDLITE